MKYHKAPKQLDEREKLRKFRELDDAFAQALRQLEDPGSDLDIPTGPPVRSLAVLEEEEASVLLEERDRLFEARLKELMSEYDLSGGALSELISTLVAFGLWPEDRSPGMADQASL
ncbi:hypothetical protein HW452_10460 [Halomonas aquamarina]|uniref:Uncharacterized protein n=1 Tax=Vreelandella aquamarina TaxID=77097 RepID=A0ACC5VVF4_9GAMM|nr:hypothetical protein [Halomonas aquamarina]MBZ5487945.1 hypothetical protein [Halomonas aquamarina]